MHREASVTPLNGTFLGRSNAPESGYRALGKRARPIAYPNLRFVAKTQKENRRNGGFRQVGPKSALEFFLISANRISLRTWN